MKRPVISQVRGEEWSPDLIITHNADGGLHGPEISEEQLDHPSTGAKQNKTDASFVAAILSLYAAQCIPHCNLRSIIFKPFRSALP
jgi:hypothetical protein